jgi:hypothetical protein
VRQLPLLSQVKQSKGHGTQVLFTETVRTGQFVKHVLFHKLKGFVQDEHWLADWQEEQPPEHCPATVWLFS